MVSDLRWPTAGWRLTACYIAVSPWALWLRSTLWVLSYLRSAEPIPTTPIVKGGEYPKDSCDD